MLKNRIILVAITAIIIWLIFLLPKVVVENEGQLATASDTVNTVAGHRTIPETLSGQIRELRRQVVGMPQNEKNSIFADSLRSLYFQAGQFDSAAWFAEHSASFFNNTASFLKAGNSFYEAYTFAMEPAKQKEMAEKTRLYLGKVLEAEPKNLEAKTKLAMTYLSSESPMQGILMLREVLAEDPKNEFALFNMGMLSIQSRQFDRAIERFTELVAINPKHTQAQLLLGVAYLNKGDKEKAKVQFEKVKQMDADPSVQATVDSYLKDLK
ncbi:MAG: tetratricopeptide repeat protein [Bacteroidota bacterium]